MQLILLYSLLLILALLCTVFIIRLIAQNRKHALHVRSLELEHEKEMEFVSTEVQENTLLYIAAELHDNYGSRLASILLLLKCALEEEGPKLQQTIQRIINITEPFMTDMRDMTMKINPKLDITDFLSTIKQELKFFNDTKFIKAQLEIIGTPYSMGQNKELNVLRICQETFTNILKHSNAEEFHVQIEYKPDLVFIRISDNGIGFDISLQKEAISSRSGLFNIRNRADIIGAELSIQSRPGIGSMLSLKVPNS